MFLLALELSDYWQTVSRFGDSGFASSFCLYDLDGDGDLDLVVGSKDGAGGNGIVYIYKNVGNYNFEFENYISAPANCEDFGAAVTAGDTDGDGYVDIIVGDPKYDAPGPIADAGAVFIYSGADLSQLTSQAGTNADDNLGASVLAANLDSDDEVEILAGAPGVDGGGTDRGQVVLIQDGGGFSSTALFNGSTDNEEVGSSLALADFDGGGVDLLIGTASGTSKIYVLKNIDISSLPIGSVDATISSADRVLSAGDWNGDGYNDLLVEVSTKPAIWTGDGSTLPSGSLTTTTVLNASNVDCALLYDLTGDGFYNLVASLSGKLYIFLQPYSQHVINVTDAVSTSLNFKSQISVSIPSDDSGCTVVFSPAWHLSSVSTANSTSYGYWSPSASENSKLEKYCFQLESTPDLQEPITFTFSLPSGVSDSKVRLFKLDEDKQVWELYQGYHSTGSSVSVTVQSDGIYRLGYASLSASDVSSVLLFPNPVTGDNDKVIVRNLPSGATVEIFTQTGRLVKKLSASNGEVVWDLKDYLSHTVSNGVYYIVVRSSAGSRSFILFVQK